MSSTERSLEETPTWAVASVCSIFIIISVVIEGGIHLLGKFFQSKQKKAMLEALEKIKSELMLLGFLSLLLTVGTKYVAKMCVPKSIGHKMLPCKNNDKKKHGDNEGEHHRRLLSSAEEMSFWLLAAGASENSNTCGKGMEVLISSSAVHQLDIFIFILAVFHVLYSVSIIGLGLAKMKKWKAWEAETTSLQYEFTNDPSRFRLAHETSFVKRHTGLSTKPGIRWLVAFFRQFFGSVSKIDYLTIRHRFINKHCGSSSQFDFHKYIKRSMEDDFKEVLGISIPLWIFSIIFLLLNVQGWHVLTYLSFLPLVNAFQMAFFLWAVYEFGINSCYHERMVEIGFRVGLGVIVHIMCSYTTVPLYALVTQMGSQKKRSIFEEKTSKALKRWQKNAKDRKKLRELGGGEGVVDISNSGTRSPENTPSRGSSPMHLLHNNKTRSTTLESEIDIPPSPRAYLSETKVSNTKGSHHVHYHPKNLHHEFSFSRC